MFGNCMMVITNQTAFALNTIVGCDAGIPGFGEISFKSDKIWKITNNVNNIHQEWSDIVMATGCNKTNYDGGMAGSYYSDCRANSNRTVFGDLFSWCAVTRFAHVLCPSPWRVPTSQDFCNLDIAMGGTGENRNTGAITMLSQYVGSGDNQWGGAYGGACQQDGSTYAQGMYAYYWSQTETDSTRSKYLHLQSATGLINPYRNHYKSVGMTLRCVK